MVRLHPNGNGHTEFESSQIRGTVFLFPQTTVRTSTNHGFWNPTWLVTGLFSVCTFKPPAPLSIFERIGFVNSITLPRSRAQHSGQLPFLSAVWVVAAGRPSGTTRSQITYAGKNRSFNCWLTMDSRIDRRQTSCPTRKISIHAKIRLLGKCFQSVHLFTLFYCSRFTLETYSHHGTTRVRHCLG